MGIARAHWLPGPLDEVTAFGQRAFALRPFQLRAHTLVLIVHGDAHHVRVTEDPVAAYRRQMVHKANHSIFRKRSERPATRLA